MDKETKDVLRPLTEMIVQICETEAVILTLLSMKLPNLDAIEREQLEKSAKLREEGAKKIAQTLGALR